MCALMGRLVGVQVAKLKKAGNEARGGVERFENDMNHMIRSVLYCLE
jgi:hypothetical protein